MKTFGVVVDYIGLAEEVQRAVVDPTAEGAGKGGGFVTFGGVAFAPVFAANGVAEFTAAVSSESDADEAN